MLKIYEDEAYHMHFFTLDLKSMNWNVSISNQSWIEKDLLFSLRDRHFLYKDVNMAADKMMPLVELLTNQSTVSMDFVPFQDIDYQPYQFMTNGHLIVYYRRFKQSLMQKL